MRRSFNPGKVPSFQKIIIASFVLHLIFIALTVVPPVHKKREIKPYYVNLVRPVATQRSETVSDVKNNVPVTKKKVEENTKKIPATKNVTAKPKMSLKSDKVDKAIKDIKSQKAEDQKKKEMIESLRSRIKNDAEKTADTAGLAVSNLYAGMHAADARQKYENSVRDIIYGYWKPQGYGIEDIDAVVDIRVDKNWKIVSFKMTEASTIRLFNNSVQKAMLDAREGTKTVPLPVPPFEMLEEVLEDGFEFTFKKEK